MTKKSKKTITTIKERGANKNGKWLNKETVIIKKKPRKRKQGKKKRLTAKPVLHANFLNMVDCKECFNPMETSNRLLTSLFNPAAGTSRGIAFGTENTALTDYYVPFDISVPANSYTVVYIQPMNALDNFFAMIGSVGGTLTSTSSVNLTNSSTFTTLTQITPPITSTSTTRYRSVGCEVRVLAASTLLNRAEYYQATYIDNMSDGLVTITAGGSPYYQGPGTYGALDQYPMKRRVNGDRDMILHWFPNDDEIYLQDYSSLSAYDGQAPNLSGFILVFPNNTSNILTYNFECRNILEYVPSDSTRVLSKKVVSTVHPLAEYYLNMLVSTKWDPLVISELTEWESLIHGSKPQQMNMATNNHYRSLQAGVRQTYRQGVITEDMLDLLADA